jgi:RNA polymerase sigma-70 factor (ECF subfamily)
MTTEGDPRDLLATRELLARVERGDQSARDDLFARYRQRLERFIRARLPDDLRVLAETQDFAQEVSIKALSALERFEYRGLGSFWAYLRRIALNHMIEVGRKQTRRGDRVSLPEGSSAPPLASASTSPLSALVRREEFLAFESALERVPERQRQALLMRLELDLDYEVIAGECGYPSADAARMSIARALKQVAEDLSRGRASS